MVPASAFSRSWAQTDFWMLLVLPRSTDADIGAVGDHALPWRAAEKTSGNSQGLATVATRAPVPNANDCDALVSEGVRLAKTGDRFSAESVLTSAIARCPATARASRELAGLRFVQSRWSEAAELAARATSLAPDDLHAWRLLASSLFLQHDSDGALRAWNRAHEPRIDLVRVEGLVHTPQIAVERLIDLTPRAELTPSDLRRARRRLAMLPTAVATRIGYRPVAGGLAEVDAAVVERPRSFDSATGIGSAAHALTNRELLFDLAPAQTGARLTAGWRWWDGRPRVGLSLLTPVAFGRSGLWRLDAFWEQQSYAVLQADDHILNEDRRRVELGYSDWITADTRVGLGIALDRWRQARKHAALFGSVERRLTDDRIAARVHGGVWPALGRATTFAAGGFALAWRSTSAADASGPVVLQARAGLDSATVRAPLDVWPGAGVGDARSALARAHPLLRDGVIDGGIFGRTLAHGGVELHTRSLRRGWARIGVAVFGDVARAWHGLSGSMTRTHVDAGFGLRVGLPGHARTLRIDVAQGLRDGQKAISASWALAWPWAE
jgi:hypothetical protein